MKLLVRMELTKSESQQQLQDLLFLPRNRSKLLTEAQHTTWFCILIQIITEIWFQMMD